MTPRERILTTLLLKEPDRVPMVLTDFNREAFRIFKERTGYDDPNRYFGVEIDLGYVEFKATKLDLNRYAPFHRGKFSLGSITFNEWGTGFVVGSNPAFDYHIPPLTYISSVEELKEYPFPDFEASYRHEHLEEEVKKIKDKKLAVVAPLEMTIFEVAWQIRGFNELMTDFLINEDLPEFLLDRITELRCFQAKRYAEAGVDIIRLGDDVGTQHKLMMSPDLWRKWLKPRLIKVINSVRKVNPNIFIFYHSDGYIEPIISDLIEIGINILNPVQPECMDPAKLKRLYGDRLVFWGTISIQRTLPFGTPEDVRKEVKERIETVGKGGGLIISPTHAIEPEVPYENIFGFVEAVKEYGNYNM